MLYYGKCNFSPQNSDKIRNLVWSSDTDVWPPRLRDKSSSVCKRERQRTGTAFILIYRLMVTTFVSLRFSQKQVLWT